MPSKNTIKQYGGQQMYHVYNRGVDKMTIFAEPVDYAYFLSLLKRHLSPKPTIDKYGRSYASYDTLLWLIAYCLMPNHFHLLVYIEESEGLEKLMRSVMTAYSAYFNKKYGRVGHLFQGIFKASEIIDDDYYMHISRYIHLNPLDIHEDWRVYAYSSLPYFLGEKKAEWLHPGMGMGELTSSQYKKFVADYESYKKDLDTLKYQLAN